MAVNNVKSQGIPLPTASPQGPAEASKSSGTQMKQAAGAYSKSAPTPSLKEAANVQISAKARELNLAKKIVDQTPDVREDKVAKFKDLIAKGEYKPDAGKIADGIMREAIKDEVSKTPDVALE